MKYLLKYALDKELQMVLEYGPDEFLISWRVDGQWPREVWVLIWHKPPLSEGGIKTLEIPNVTMQLVPEDLTFERFWEEYGFKMGNKAKTERQYNELKEEEKVAIFKAIPKYLYWLSCGTVAQAMPSTWLNQRRWENDFKVKR
jgi:hypothetical protein